MTRYVQPSENNLRVFSALTREGPIQMLNLVKFRARADYQDGRNATGAEAYGRYRDEVAPVFQKCGARIVWSGRPEVMVIGPEQGEEWDIAFIAEYPDMASFITMIRDPAYLKGAIHRAAAVENSRLIRMAPA